MSSALKLAGSAVGVAAVAALILIDPLAATDLPDLPDVPGWVAFLIGPGKLILLVLAGVLAWLAESARRRDDPPAQ